MSFYILLIQWRSEKGCCADEGRFGGFLKPWTCAPVSPNDDDDDDDDDDEDDGR
jgi:hypothetical protein